MKFSERVGAVEIKKDIIREGAPKTLRVAIWNYIYKLVDSYHPLDFMDFTQKYYNKYRLPLDEIPKNIHGYNEIVIMKELKNHLFLCQWFKFFDFIEFFRDFHNELINTRNKKGEIEALQLSEHSKETDIAIPINTFLKEELSAYRFVDGVLLEINSKEEIKEIEAAIKSADWYQNVKEHLRAAIKLFSNRESPDYRNSIKESISAVEALVKIILGDDKTTLGKALNEIEKKHKIPGSLKSAFKSLYGYTSDSGGIRHSLLKDDVSVDIEEARFMLIACSAFTNYLSMKLKR